MFSKIAKSTVRSLYSHFPEFQEFPHSTFRSKFPLQALARELEAQLPDAESLGKEANMRKRENWKTEIIRAFEAAAGDLKGTTERDILDEIKLYRAQRKKTPEIRVIALSQERTAERDC